MSASVSYIGKSLSTQYLLFELYKAQRLKLLAVIV